VEDLERAAAAIGIGVDVVDFRGLRARIGEERARSLEGRPASSASDTCEAVDAVGPRGIDLSTADAVLVRAMPAGSLEQVVFRMDALHALAARGVHVVNGPRALEAAIDKYLSLCRLEIAGVPVPPTLACESVAGIETAFDELDGDVVIKPLFGSEGRGLERCRSRRELRDAARRAVAEHRVVYVQRFIDHGGEDLRVFVLGDESLGSMRRVAPHGGWVTNVAQGGIPSPVKPDAAMIELALRAARAVEAEIAGVDIVRDGAARPYVLEVNAVPGWRALAPVCGVDVADRIVRHATRHRAPQAARCATEVC